MFTYDSTNTWADARLEESEAHSQNQNEQLTERDEKFLTLGEGLGRIMDWCFFGNKKEHSKGPRAQTAMIRFVAMAAVLRPELLGNMSYAQIGKKLHRNNRTISQYAIEFQSRFKIHSRRNRTKAARKQFLDRHYEKFHEPDGI